MSIGNVISLIGLVVAGVVGFFTLQSQTDTKITTLQNEINTLKSQFAQAAGTASSNASALAEVDSNIAAKVAEEIADLQPVPANIVVAFDDSNGCPSGWVPFGDADGRMIVGAGSSGGSIPSAETRKYREHGGKEEHVLNVNEIPTHSHISTIIFEDRYVSRFEVQPNVNSPRNAAELPTKGWSDLRMSGEGGDRDYPFSLRMETDSRNNTIKDNEVGGSKPHNNMPPYIALYFCKKLTG